MIKWIKAFIIGVIIWIILTFIYGFVIGMLNLSELSFFKSNYSIFNNFILLPVGIWLSFKITKTSFFGSQKNDTPNSAKPKENIDYHTNNFFDNWDNLKTFPFRDALITHLKNYDQDRIVKSIMFERMQLPKNIEKELRLDQPTKYWTGINTALEDPDFLGRVTVFEAFKSFVSTNSTTKAIECCKSILF